MFRGINGTGKSIMGAWPCAVENMQDILSK